MPVVKMPDGTLVDMPDNPAPDQLEKLKGLLSSASNGVMDAAKNIGTGLYKGALGLPAMFAENAPALDPGGMPVDRMGAEQPRPQISNMLNNSGYQPKTAGERFVNSMSQGVGGAMLGPGGVLSPLKTAAIGASSGAGSEVGANLFGDNALSRVLGGLAGGMGAGLATSAKTTRADMAREALSDTRPQDLDAARAAMVQSRAAGVPTNLSQAMPRESNIDSLVSALANNQYGKKVTEQLRSQPQQVSFGMEDQMQKLPGNIRMPQVVANNAQEAASEAVRGGMKQATAAWEKHAPVDAMIPVPALAVFDKKLADLAAKYPNTAQAELVNDVRQAIKAKPTAPPTGPQILGPDGMPLNPPPAQAPYLTEALQVKGAIDDVLSNFGARKLNTPSLQGKELRRAQEVREIFKQVIDDNVPALSKANQAFSSVMEGVVDPMKKGVVGRIAQPGGAQDNREAVRGKIFQVLEAGTIPGGKSSEILTLEKSMRKIKPDANGNGINGAEAFQDSVKTWMASKVSDASKSVKGRMSDNVAADLEKAFFGTDVKSQGTSDMLVGMARSQGLPDDALLNGMKNWLKIVGQAANRPSSVRGISPAGFDEVAQNSVLKSVGNISVITPFRQPVLKWLEFLKRDAYKAMDGLLTTPEGVDTLRKLGKQPVMSKAAQDTISTFLATQATEDSPGVMPE